MRISFNKDLNNALNEITSKFNEEEVKLLVENFLKTVKPEYRNKDLFASMKEGYDNAISLYCIWKDSNYRNIAKGWAKKAALVNLAEKMNLI